ncbi:MAG: pyridoxal-phosphate dependent enzyme, partial [Oscillospiraceae bacterium]|nr:pyridoxal-phosphate dependent enzyme [Oscillospiraceae bacterium]
SYEDIYREMDRIGEELGRKVYKIPCGGSNALGTLGYIDCMEEVALSGQHFEHLVCACGSGGTAAGYVLGAKLHLPGTQVMCSMVDNDPFDVIVPQLMREAAGLLDIDLEIPVPDLVEMWGPGYSIPSEEGNEAIEMMMKLEGIVLDTCYTGKAFAGLIRRAREGFYKADDNVLFVHTGGAGGLFAQDWETEK